MIRAGVLCILLLGFLAGCALTPSKGGEEKTSFRLLGSLVDFYQRDLNHLSAVKASECPMYPSCSEYSKECIQKYGSVVGWAMSIDRLMRCGRDELSRSQKILVDGKWKYYDPVVNNDFWWAKRQP
jgi:putative component of membrane protein insertase Oxa1/YidC/SpoIIIJ protein YidD